MLVRTTNREKVQNTMNEEEREEEEDRRSPLEEEEELRRRNGAESEIVSAHWRKAPVTLGNNDVDRDRVSLRRQLIARAQRGRRRKRETAGKNLVAHTIFTGALFSWVLAYGALMSRRAMVRCALTCYRFRLVCSWC